MSVRWPRRWLVSIRAPRVRGDFREIHQRRRMGFNSRPSGEGRHCRAELARDSAGFNSRPSGEGRLLWFSFAREYSVSIRAPRVRGDDERYTAAVNEGFNSRPSGEGRQQRAKGAQWAAVSIRAPRVRGDLSAQTLRPP